MYPAFFIWLWRICKEKENVFLNFYTKDAKNFHLHADKRFIRKEAFLIFTLYDMIAIQKANL